MEKPQFRRTFLKEWRKKRGLSLRRLADRLEVEPGGETLLSHTSIGRIENGEQPYTQQTIEALANALNCSVTDLLEVNPEKEGEVVDIVRKLLRGRSEEEQLRILATIEAAFPRRA